MITVLRILFALSVACPIYTYAVYPLILRLLPGKQYKTSEADAPSVSVIVRGEDLQNKKVRNLKASDYPAGKLEIFTAVTYEDLKSALAQAQGEIIVFSDEKTEYDAQAIRNLTKHFADERVGCVVGKLRRKPDANGQPTESAYWKYENKVKELESRIGCHSGANAAIYAVRKTCLPQIKETVMNPDFYIATSIQMAGFDVLMASDAVAYEPPEADEAAQFRKHVQDAAAYYQALAMFWKLLLPRKGSFVYIGHRVLKWLVPFNMIAALISSAVLGCFSTPMAVLFGLQVAGYLTVGAISFYSGKKKLPGNALFKLIGLASYFVTLNASYLCGAWVYLTSKKNNRGTNTH